MAAGRRRTVKADARDPSIFLSPPATSAVFSSASERAPGAKILLLSLHEDAMAELALRAGGDVVVLKRSLATDFVPVVDDLLTGNVTFRRNAPHEVNKLN